MTKTYWFEAMTSVVPSLRMSLHLLHSAWDEVNATRYDGARAFRTDSTDV